MHHINLLPPERRQNLRRGLFLVAGGRLLRTFTIGFGLLSVVGVGAIVVLWVLSLALSQATDAEIARGLTEYNQLTEQIGEDNSLLTLIDGLGKDRLLWAENLLSVLREIPPDVTIDTLTLVKVQQGMQLSFSGIALTRNGLVVFEERLRKISWVSAVDAPRTNLLLQNDVPYSFSLIVTTELPVEGR